MIFLAACSTSTPGLPLRQQLAAQHGASSALWTEGLGLTPQTKDSCYTFQHNRWVSFILCNLREGNYLSQL